ERTVQLMSPQSPFPIASSVSSELVTGASGLSNRHVDHTSRFNSPSYSLYSSLCAGFLRGVSRGTFSPKASWKLDPTAPPQLAYQHALPARGRRNLMISS